MVIVFVRVKPHTHCLIVNLQSKRHTVKWNKEYAIILEMSYEFYKSERQWLINHPSLSCYTEIQLIKQYDSLVENNGYNIASGGDNTSGTHLTEEHKAKISQAHKDGRIPVQISIFSEEIRNQIIEERKSGKSISELKIQYNISNTHLYRILKECVNLKGQMKHNLGKSWKLVNGKRVWSVKNGT